MAKVKIQGNASGTGVITLIAPNTNTDRTVTLPDESITLGGGVDGIVSTANATAITIDSSENVGIGKTPSVPMDFEGSQAGDVVAKITNTNTTSGFGLKVKGGGTDTDRYVLRCDDAAGNDRFRVMADGRGLSQFTAKAWIKVNQTGTQVINDSHNISSILDTGTGVTKVTFTNNLGNADYSVTTSSEYNSYQGLYNLSSSRFYIYIMNSGNVYEDRTSVCAQVFGD
jgi:hypothetical protein